MIEVIKNPNNISDNAINEVVVRCKALIINNDHILIANENDVLQFPGGHLEENESLEDCLKREIMEETGILLEESEVGKPFLKISTIYKDWPKLGHNRLCDIYYFAIITSKMPNLTKIHLTKSEKEKNFKCEFVPLGDAISYIENNIPKNDRNLVISPDMISAIKEYLK